MNYHWQVKRMAGAYTGQIAPSLRQAPQQCIAAQIQLLQLHQRVALKT